MHQCALIYHQMCRQHTVDVATQRQGQRLLAGKSVSPPRKEGGEYGITDGEVGDRRTYSYYFSGSVRQRDAGFAGPHLTVSNE